MEAVAAVMAIQTGMVRCCACAAAGAWLICALSAQLHPNPNLKNPDPRVDLSILVGATAQAHPVDVALSNSFGFGGHNSCSMFSKLH